MANTTFQLRRSSVAGKVPNTSSISIGELGLNLTDQVLYSSNGTGIFEIGSNISTLSVTTIIANGSTGTANQVLTSNGTVSYWANSSGGGGGSAYFKGNDGPIGDASAANNLMRINSNTQSNNITVIAGENALMVGPITIGSGNTLTIDTGARVVIA
tara:strand:+ start:12023 stop:12493 length:471 start_codon:yes stop_codon:yes gene_type:complete